MENKLNFMLKQEQKNDFSAFRKAKPEKIGDIDGKNIYILKDDE